MRFIIAMMLMVVCCLVAIVGMGLYWLTLGRVDPYPAVRSVLALTAKVGKIDHIPEVQELLKE